MNEILEGLELVIREINGQNISDDQFPKLMTREEIIETQSMIIKSSLFL